MIVVSDASPLIALASIHCLHIIPDLLGNIVIPQAVADELNAKGPKEGVPDVLSALNDCVTVRSPAERLEFHGLHAGEAEALALAIELQARLLIDDRAGRKAAAANGVAVFGTIALLLEAAANGIIDLRESFNRLKATKFHFPSTRLDRLLDQFEQQGG